jgi:hypothetical protein
MGTNLYYYKSTTEVCAPIAQNTIEPSRGGLGRSRGTEILTILLYLEIEERGGVL